MLAFADGMILFPAAGVFEDFGPMGVSMFFVTAVVAQLVYTFGGSGFAGANGSMMIEVVVRALFCYGRREVTELHASCGLPAIFPYPCQ